MPSHLLGGLGACVLALGTMLPLESDPLFDSLWTDGGRPLLRVRYGARADVLL